MERPWIKPFNCTVEQTGETKDNYVLPCRGLKLIGIRFYPFPGADRETEKKVNCRLSVPLAMVYLVPNTVLAHWIYLVGVAGVLALGYVVFMKKYYHLHEE